MKIIKLHHPITGFKPLARVVLAMGFFDGVHRGHQKVIQTAANIAQRKHLSLAVLTYDHHPKLVYKKLDGNNRCYLTLDTLKMNYFKALGVDIVYQVSYTGLFQSQTPQMFVDNYILGLNVDTAVAGFDHTYGSGEDANMKHLSIYTKGQADVQIVSATEYQDRKVSSTWVKETLLSGNVTLTEQLLGHPFQMQGTVVHGFARGRELGYPTANVETSIYQWLPCEGVYIVSMQIGDEWYPGMAQIGRNVTFGDHNPVTIEINLLDFNQNIYGEVVNVKWLKRLRGEVKFNGMSALIQQLKLDEQNTRKYFKL